MKRLLILLLLCNASYAFSAEESISPDNKGILREVGIGVGIGIIGHLAERAIDHMIDHKPAPRPKPTPAPRPNPPSRGSDPSPEPCPGPGNAML